MAKDTFDELFTSCLLCDKDMLEFWTTWFTDKDGIRRHGSICVDCYWEQKIGGE